MTAVGVRCTGVRANELVVRGCCCTVTWHSARCLIVRHMCLDLMAMYRVDQRLPVALEYCKIGWPRVGCNNFGMYRVRGEICHGLGVVVFNALVLFSKET